MSLSFAVLGSGSAGNCTLVRCHGESRPYDLLIDCGFSPRTVASRLQRVGGSIHDIRDVVLTHLDWDHMNAGWRRFGERRGITIHVHERHRRAAIRAGIPARALATFGRTLDLPGVQLHTTMLAHDEHGTVGFVIEAAGARLGFATDLGRVTPVLLDQFSDLHALAIESNYDQTMQRESGRPEFLKRRIMGGAGHLSNDQALEAIIEIDRRSRLQHIALLHLSRECNCTKLLQSLYVSRAPHLVDRVVMSSQHAPTRMIDVGARGARSAPESPAMLFDLVAR